MLLIKLNKLHRIWYRIVIKKMTFLFPITTYKDNNGAGNLSNV